LQHKGAQYFQILFWAGLVQLVSASSPSHQVLGSKPSLCRISAGVRLCFGYSLPQTPLVWESLALGLPLFLRSKTWFSHIECLVCWLAGVGSGCR
jgi:hypothetical protein